MRTYLFWVEVARDNCAVSGAKAIGEIAGGFVARGCGIWVIFDICNLWSEKLKFLSRGEDHYALVGLLYPLEEVPRATLHGVMILLKFDAKCADRVIEREYLVL